MQGKTSSFRSTAILCLRDQTLYFIDCDTVARDVLSDQRAPVFILFTAYFNAMVGYDHDKGNFHERSQRHL